MLRRSSAVPALGRVLLACSLCLLAFAFAIEAKMAWYAPALGPTRDISAAKAWPTDIPVVADEHASIIPIPLGSSFQFLSRSTAVFTAATGAIAAAGVSETRLLARHPVPVSSRPYFTPLVFLRPPPALF